MIEVINSCRQRDTRVNATNKRIENAHYPTRCRQSPITMSRDYHRQFARSQYKRTCDTSLSHRDRVKFILPAYAWMH